MHHKHLSALTIVIALAAAVSLAGAVAAGQAPAQAGKSWAAPRAADGRPDISGIWEHNAATPLERPDELAGKTMLTDDEVRTMEATAAKLFGGDGDAAFGDSIYVATLRNVLGSQKGFKSRDATTGDYNSFWVVGRWFENRTALISDPPNGKMPPMTDAAKKRRADAAERRRLHPFDGPEDIALGERCITGSVPMLGAGYNNYYQIIQTPSSVAIGMEMRHDTRMVAISNRAHLPKEVQMWLGDPVGRWDGDTFVVDSTNFRNDSPVAGGGASESLHLVERFTRVAPETLKYEVTLDDPATWTKPWTAVLFMKKTTDPIFEYACHEGNELMTGTLRGARTQEKSQREKAAPAAGRPAGSSN